MISDFIEKILILCYKYQGSVSSWGRTREHNTDVGGVHNSFHMLWLGIDVVFKPMVKNVEFEQDADLLGLQAIFEGDHYHLEPK